jgi:outer membrane receptor protein involved in Fe transport
VLTPTFLDGFTATVDYFNIKVKQLIDTLPEANIIAGCANSGLASVCDLVQRSTSGTLFGSGYVSDLTTNTGYLKNEGVDVEVNYQTDLDQLGMGNNGAIQINLIGTYTAAYTTEPFQPAFFQTLGLSGNGTFECSGRYGSVCGTPTPKWRHKLRVTWSSPWDIDLSLAWRFIGASSLDYNVTSNPLLAIFGNFHDAANAHIEAYNYFDLAANWTVRQGVELRAGMTNVFDKDPPIGGTFYVTGPPFGNGNTFPAVYDALGRVMFVGATLKY